MDPRSCDDDVDASSGAHGGKWTCPACGALYCTHDGAAPSKRCGNCGSRFDADDGTS